MAKLRLIRTDERKIEEGVWVKYLDDIELCIASTDNAAFVEHKNRLLRPHIRDMRAKQAVNDNAAVADIVNEAIKPAVARDILRGWKNIQDDDGKDIPYAPQTALDFFRQPSMRDLYKFILEFATEVQNFRQELLEEAEKNLSPSSNGVSP